MAIRRRVATGLLTGPARGEGCYVAMSFPQSIKEDALVACGRRCSICHKFCGLKIELHHIVHQAEGGADTYDNCIPLCFDCHADMRSYDHNHPKGTKYSENELKRHRDDWYAKVEGAGPVTSQPDYTPLDLATLKRILELLPWDGTMRLIDENNFAGFSFETERLSDLYRFLHFCADPSCEFIDADLEAARADLQESLRLLSKTIEFETFPTRNVGWSSVPPEWEIEQPERFAQVVETIHAQARRAVSCYQNLVRLGRHKLAGPGQPPGAA
jgi:hypothetical protein